MTSRATLKRDERIRAEHRKHLDKAFKVACKREARELRKSCAFALKTGALAFAIEQQAKAEVWEVLSDVGLEILS